MSFENDLRRLDALGELIRGSECVCRQDRVRVTLYGDRPGWEPPPPDGVIRKRRSICPLHGPIYTHISNLTGYGLEVFE